MLALAMRDKPALAALALAIFALAAGTYLYLGHIAAPVVLGEPAALIYYLPGDPRYDAVAAGADTQAFRSAGAAETQGYRKSQSSPAKYAAPLLSFFLLGLAVPVFIASALFLLPARQAVGTGRARLSGALGRSGGAL